jgi:hypothetical protein
MATELELIKQQIDLNKKEIDVFNKSAGIEFERIARAFNQMGNLLDLLYLEVSVLVEMLASKKVITQEEFSKTLEETAKKVEEQMKKAQEEPAKAPEVTPEKL